jgi:hypothetical protein
MQAKMADDDGDDSFKESNNKRTKYAGRSEEDELPSVTIKTHSSAPPSKNNFSDQKHVVPSSTETASEWEEKEEKSTQRL